MSLIANLYGRLGGDPVARTIKSGKDMTRVQVAVAVARGGPAAAPTADCRPGARPAPGCPFARGELRVRPSRTHREVFPATDARPGAGRAEDRHPDRPRPGGSDPAAESLEEVRPSRRRLAAPGGGPQWPTRRSGRRGGWPGQNPRGLPRNRALGPGIRTQENRR